jgi:hypothetical protein
MSEYGGVELNHFLSRHWMEGSGWVHASAILPAWKIIPISFGCDSRWLQNRSERCGAEKYFWSLSGFEPHSPLLYQLSYPGKNVSRCKFTSESMFLSHVHRTCCFPLRTYFFASPWLRLRSLILFLPSASHWDVWTFFHKTTLRCEPSFDWDVLLVGARHECVLVGCWGRSRLFGGAKKNSLWLNSLPQVTHVCALCITTLLGLPPSQWPALVPPPLSGVHSYLNL